MRFFPADVYIVLSCHVSGWKENLSDTVNCCYFMMHCYVSLLKQYLIELDESFSILNLKKDVNH